ncbi:hypothetical protein [Actinoplanes rectilineatus]|uniref:hypothetical protein n=1 Tax=Actinoplanes rectilineatus TaxID=113571 RepID=UPI001FDFEFB8|nr:hypothetical protein [Actinoplanes rectilineatus]
MVTSEPGMAGLRRGRLKSRRARLLLALTGGITALLCLGGAGAIFLIYDQSTEIKRTAPDAVVDNFLRAYLVNRSDDETSLYACNDDAKFAPLLDLRNEIIDREAKFKVNVSVSWSTLIVSSEAGNQKSVSVDLVIAGFSKGVATSRRTEGWSFAVVDEDGWRVCGANKL